MNANGNAKNPTSDLLLRRAQIGLEKRVRTRLHLLTAAVDVFGRPEGKASSIDEVIAHAGASRGTFYNYFSDRTDLLSNVSVELSKDFNDAIIHALRNTDDAAVRAAVGVRHYIVKALKDRSWAWAMLNVSLNGPLLGTDTLFHITDTIERGAKTGRFSVNNTQAAVDLLVGTIISAISSTIEKPHTRSYPQDITYMFLCAMGLERDDAQTIASARLPKIDFIDRAHERAFLTMSLDTSKSKAFDLAEFLPTRRS